MKIVFVVDSCFNIYRKRMYYNLVSLLGDRHDLQYIKPQKNLISKLKAMQPDILYLIVGGREHNEILTIFQRKAVTVSDFDEGCDITINDEPEQVFPALVEALESGKHLSTIRGITYRQTTDAANKWDISGIKPTSCNESFLTFSTRGCRGRCSFCNIRLLQGELRYRPIPEIIAEIRSFADIKGFKGHFQFADPSFDSNTPERLKAISRALINEVPGHTFGANFRPNSHEAADDELMNLLIEAGLTTVFIGAESGNSADLELYAKGATVSDAERTIQLFRQYDCFVSIGFINFNPFSTFEKLRENLNFLERNRLATYERLKSCLALSRGLPIKQTIIDEGLLYDHSYDVRDSMVKALMAIISDIDKKLNAKALDIYSWLSTGEAKRRKRIAERNGDVESYAIAYKYEKLIESVAMFESDLMAEWFRNILDMMDNAKPLTEIMAMSERYLNDEKLKATIKYFKALENSMFQELKELYDSRKVPDKT